MDYTSGTFDGSIGSANTNGSTDTTTGLFMWSDPIRIDFKEYDNRIEIIYKQKPLFTSVEYPPNIKVFKIVYSCVDGKWNKSEPIYGEVIPAENERYEFE